jgi:broad specificity phosphatase PhoE
MARQAGTITIARHGQPAISRDVLLSPAEYGAFWERYESTGLTAGQSAPEHLTRAADEAEVVIVSTRPRAVQSAQVLLGGKPFRQDPRLIEAPLPHPPFPGFLRLTPQLWGFFARVWWWFFNHHRGQETWAQARTRAAAIAAEVAREAEEGRNVLIIAHGFFNFMVGAELRRLGWRKAWGRGWKYWSTRRYERR